MIVINFKNYVSGKKSVELARKIEKFLGKRAIVCPPTIDIEEVASKTGLKVFAQHLSKYSGKRATGFVLAESVKKVGGKGTLLNHSEHRLTESGIRETMKECNRVGFKVILCVASLGEARKYKKLRPWAMAFEDRKLIGSGKSITSYRAEEVKEFVKVLKGGGVIPLCGAGIHSVDDYKAARDFGCKGVLIASAIAKDLKKGGKFLRELMKVLIESSVKV